MPTYDYLCEACDHKFELFQSIKAEPEKKCPECGKRKLRRLFGTGAAIVFKGSGFYQTDYRSESYKERASKESSENAPKTSEGESKPADAKPAAGSGEAKPAAGGDKPASNKKKKDSAG